MSWQSRQSTRHERRDVSLTPNEPSQNIYVTHSQEKPLFGTQKGSNYPPDSSDVPSIERLCDTLDITDNLIREALNLAPAEPVAEAHRITHLIGALFRDELPKDLPDDVQPYGPELRIQDENFAPLFAPLQICRIELTCLSYDKDGNRLAKPQTWLHAFNRAQQVVLQVRPDTIMPKETAGELPLPEIIVRLGALLEEVPCYRPNRKEPRHILPEMVQSQMNNCWDQPDRSDFAIILSREYIRDNNGRIKLADCSGKKFLVSRGISKKRQWNVRTIRLSQ